MDEIKKKPKINITYLLVIVIFTLAGFFIGQYHAEKRITQKIDPTPITKYLPADRHIENLMLKTGWEDPEAKLIEDLASKPEVIPVDPVLGGTMGFYDHDNIYLLNDKWVLAPFEDGHIGGYLLLEFHIEEEIEWHVLSYYLE
ncbi:MAG: hypothetical protein K0B81_06780 [Candidatus Cloacimonetes bacterium]|nr:hypothetical protein [Candidatus Cloacimonadota bacterium]